MKKMNAYTRIIEKIFRNHFQDGDTEVSFERDEIIEVAKMLKIKLPKNLGDIVYSFRYRAELPDFIKSKAPTGFEWIIIPAGKAKYAFVLRRFSKITPSMLLGETKIPNSTPGIIESYALSDEQALLAKIRYNRLVDIFTGVTCYSLQSHLRTTVPGIGQVETDEIYIGIDKKGVHYALPIQAKGTRDKLGVVQIEQDVSVCREKFPNLIARPIGAQFIAKNLIAMFEFEATSSGVSVVLEKHYHLVDPTELTTQDLLNYRKRTE